MSAATIAASLRCSRAMPAPLLSNAVWHVWPCHRQRTSVAGQMGARAGWPCISTTLVPSAISCSAKSAAPGNFRSFQTSAEVCLEPIGTSHLGQDRTSLDFLVPLSPAALVVAPSTPPSFVAGCDNWRYAFNKMVGDRMRRRQFSHLFGALV